MRKVLTLLVVVLTGVATQMFGQSPAPGILNYQGVARNSVGNVLQNKTISLRLSIRDGSATGPVVYSETRTVTTNPFGLFNVQLGSPGATAVTGTIAGVPWGVGAKFIQVEIDPNGGTAFINIGTAQLASVPYALYATTSADLVLPFNKTQSDAGSLFTITNSNTTSSGASAIVGNTNSTAGNAFAVVGRVTSTSPGGFSAGVRGINNGTGGLGIGVWGSQDGSGWGVYGTAVGGIGGNFAATSGTGVMGTSQSGTGVMGSSNTGRAGVFFVSNTTSSSTAVDVTTAGTGTAGLFTINNMASGATALVASTNGTGGAGSFTINNAAATGDALTATTNGGATSWALRATSTGAQGAGIFTYNNAAGSANAVRVTNNGSGAALSATHSGTGSVGVLNISNAASSATALDVSTVGTGGAGSFTINNVAATADALTATTNGGATSWALRATSTGAQGAGIFTYNNAAGSANAVRVMNNGSGAALFASTSGTGNAGRFDNTNAANTAPTVLVNNNAGGGGSQGIRVNMTHPTSQSWGLYSQIATTGIGSAAVYGVDLSSGAITTPDANTYGVVGTTGTTGIGVGGFADNGGTAVRARGGGALGWALHTTGRVRLAGINEATNRVLTSIDATGNAEWRTLAAIGGVSGSGTLNFVPKWTPDGSTLGNSQIFDNGNHVGIGTNTPLDDRLNVHNTTALNYAGTHYTNTGTGQSITDGFYVGQNSDIGVSEAVIINMENTDILLATNATARMWVKNTGRVGINNPAPVAQLQVDGNGSSTSVTGTWPGFTPNSYFRNTAASNDNKAGAISFARGSTNLNFGQIGIAGGEGIFNYGVAGLAGETSTGGNIGVLGQVTGSGSTNYGVVGSAPVGVNNWAGYFQGRVAIIDGTQGAGKVFTSDASGTGSWQTPAAAGLVSGGGTLNYVPKWTPNGTTLGNSNIFVNAANFSTSINSTTMPAINALNVDGGRVQINGSAAVGFPTLYLNTYDIGTNGGIVFSSSTADGTNDNGRIVYRSGGDYIAIAHRNGGATSSGLSDLVVKHGNIGVATTTPAAKLEVRGFSNNTFTTPSGYTVNIGVASVDMSSSLSSKTGIYSYVNGSSLNNLSVWGDAGTDAFYNIGLFGTVFINPSSGSNSVGLYALDLVGSPNTWAAVIQGRLRYSDGSQGNNKVLHSDASGNATWKGPVGISLVNSTGQSIPSTTFTDINSWATVQYEDGGANFNPLTGEYTIPETGVYQIYASIGWDLFSNPAMDIVVIILRNGSQVALGFSNQITTGGVYPSNSQATYVARLNAGDKIKIQAWQNSGSSVNLNSSTHETRFSVTLISR